MSLQQIHLGHQDSDVAPFRRVVGVLKALPPENWIHNGGTDFAVQLKPPSASDVLGKVLTAEGTYTHWSLFNRFILANEILDAADSAGIDSFSLTLWFSFPPFEMHVRQALGPQLSTQGSQLPPISVVFGKSGPLRRTWRLARVWRAVQNWPSHALP